ncbi:MAG: Do family serine endopeptidase [Rhodocyclaceae bacterium]|nr:Do family serine endopeptidase [Rhodocyclaceae bacterium]MBP6109166.1 Do family serine endopeptidase [Rhodocyclaceae bacterium]MBP6278947.1 Do family serine endopeptidase [Rhodocyclaceae bacterium]
MRRLWLIFAQTVTICVAVLFVIKTLKPEWMASAQLTTHALSEATTSSATNAPAAITEAPNPAPGSSPPLRSHAEAVKRALPAVVHIYTSQQVRTSRHPFANDPMFRQFFGDRFPEEAQRRSGLGSGVVVSPDGYVLTNFHVVEGADEIEVAASDDKKYKARVVGADPESDLAVLRIQSDHALPVISFGNSDALRVGDVVLAIGNPFGVGQTVTSGIVSALGRSHLGINRFENFIQTDAAINPGNSGGALIDSNGNLIGINAAIYSQSGGSMGIGFAIPVSLAKSVMEQIVKNGSVTRGWVGVEVQELTPELAESFKLPDTRGALISGVMRGSPADKAGIKPGDILLGIDGKNVEDSQAMLELIAAFAPGSATQFEIRRNGQTRSLAITIGKRPAVKAK